MLKKSERLDRTTFSKVFSKGKRIHNPYTTGIYLPEDFFSCSVVVSKKVSKKAPVRNTIRRKIYSLIEKQKRDKNLVGLYIFLVKAEVAKLTKRAFNLAMEEEVGRVIN